MIFTCPHCKGKATIRTSRSINPLLRELNYQCHDVECGHTFSAWLEVYETISPSAKPDPLVHIPMSEYTRRKLLQNSTLNSSWRKAFVASPIEATPATQDRSRPRYLSALPAKDGLTQALFSTQNHPPATSTNSMP